MHVCACETLAVMHIVMSVFQIVLALLGVLHCILCPSILLCSNVFDLYWQTVGLLQQSGAALAQWLSPRTSPSKPGFKSQYHLYESLVASGWASGQKLASAWQGSPHVGTPEPSEGMHEIKRPQSVSYLKTQNARIQVRLDDMNDW